MQYTCLVCGYVNAGEEIQADPYIAHDICLCCDFQYGFTDWDSGFTYEQWRAKWIKEGMQWNEGDSEPPAGWNPRRQLLNVIPASEIPK